MCWVGKAQGMIHDFIVQGHHIEEIDMMYIVTSELVIALYHTYRQGCHF